MVTRSQVFSRDPEFCLQSHGRIYLLGEHSEWQGGLALSLQMPQFVQVEIVRRKDLTVVVGGVIGMESPIGNACRYLLGSETRLGLWTDYVQGVTSLLAATGSLRHQFSGFEAWIRSNIPMGAGFGSSTALVIAFLRALDRVFRLEMRSDEIAHLCQRVENEFVGSRIGALDAMTMALGTENAALLVDTRDFSHRLISMEADRFRLIVIHSGIHLRNARDRFSERRDECRQAAAALSLSLLRDLEIEDLQELGSFPPHWLPRARHIVSENERVRQAIAALAAGDAKRLGDLLSDSQRSLREDFEVSLPEIDSLVRAAQEQPEVFGARLASGGFGGAVVIVARPDSGVDVAERIARRYQHLTHRDPEILVPSRGREALPLATTPDLGLWDLGHS